MSTKYEIIEIDQATFWERFISCLTESEKKKYFKTNESYGFDEFLFFEFCQDNNLFPHVEQKVNEGFLYLFKYEDFYKIGFTSDVNRRLKDISFYPPFDVEFVASVKLKNPREAEKYWHEYYSEYQIKGEWFLFKNREFMDMVMFMLSEGGKFDQSIVYSAEEITATEKTINILLGDVA